MNRSESYVSFLGVALALTVGVLVIFQIYVFGEPARIAGFQAHDQSVAVTAGQALFKTNCTLLPWRHWRRYPESSGVE